MVRQNPADGRLANLPWPAHKGHLTMFIQMILNHLVIDPPLFIHE